jgi:predicted neutral ceramidase superfamily lipid hydrolase
MATTIETDWKEVLGEINQQLNEIQRDVTTLKVDMATVKADLTTVKEDVKDLKSSQRSQIWALIITVIGATIAAVVKFGFFPNP